MDAEVSYCLTEALFIHAEKEHQTEESLFRGPSTQTYLTLTLSCTVRKPQRRGPRNPLQPAEANAFNCGTKHLILNEQIEIRRQRVGKLMGKEVICKVCLLLYLQQTWHGLASARIFFPRERPSCDCRAAKPWSYRNGRINSPLHTIF